jgi:SAM-dependent methyltransferase
VRAAAKRRVRSAVDRVAMPYVDAVVSRLAGPGANELAPIASNHVPAGQLLHLALHELRTIELERVPKGARKVLSVGASGRWYFDWFERAVGTVDEHLGVEAYEAKPGDLPPYATWIADTADHMVGVDDSSVDLVFAGQTTEHLWSGELSGFLEEAHRVLSADGLLILDSPNRLVTEHLNWTHEGHTVELSLKEISELVTLAGFDVISTAGIWRCEIDDRVLQLEDGLDDSAMFTRRTSTARDNPDQSYIWWLNARRNDRRPDSSRLRSRAKELFENHWNTRVCRGLFPEPGADRLAIAPGSAGSVGKTLPFLLKQGALDVTATLLSGSWDDLRGFAIDIVSPGGDLLHHLTPETAEDRNAALHWSVDQGQIVFGATIDVRVELVRSPVQLQLPLEVSCDV